MVSTFMFAHSTRTCFCVKDRTLRLSRLPLQGKLSSEVVFNSGAVLGLSHWPSSDCIHNVGAADLVMTRLPSMYASLIHSFRFVP